MYTKLLWSLFPRSKMPLRAPQIAISGVRHSDKAFFGADAPSNNLSQGLSWRKAASQRKSELVPSGRSGSGKVMIPVLETDSATDGTDADGWPAILGINDSTTATGPDGTTDRLRPPATRGQRGAIRGGRSNPKLHYFGPHRYAKRCGRGHCSITPVFHSSTNAPLKVDLESNPAWSGRQRHQRCSFSSTGR